MSGSGSSSRVTTTRVTKPTRRESQKLPRKGDALIKHRMSHEGEHRSLMDWIGCNPFDPEGKVR
jgi:hypothetical protein